MKWGSSRGKFLTARYVTFIVTPSLKQVALCSWGTLQFRVFRMIFESFTTGNFLERFYGCDKFFFSSLAPHLLLK